MFLMLKMTAALGATLFLAGGAMAGPAPKSTYNGTWAVQILTEAGPCDRAYNYSIAIQDGRVRQASKTSDAVITGQIRPDGVVALGLQSGPASADASGRLKASAGSGRWTLPMLGCSGRWNAQKRTVQASAS
jgi:hypothetical protein